MKKINPFFKQGLKDGLPIGLGYFPLAFTLGVGAVTGGFNFLITNAMSVLSFSGVSMMTGFALIGEHTTYFSFFLALLIINLRNIVLSISLSQKLETNISAWKKLFISLGNTDEIFALTIRHEGIIRSDYFLGVMALPYFLWVAGTIIGSIATTLVPKDVCVAMTMALYAMLISSLIPAMKQTRPIFFVAVLSGIISFIMQGIKPISEILYSILGRSASSWILIVGSVFSAAIAAIIWPVNDSKG